VDEVIKVSDADAFEGSKQLARLEGIFAGTSSGAAFHAALSLARRVRAGNIVALFPDRGDRYFSQGLYD
jgi:cysteine synthase